MSQVRSRASLWSGPLILLAVCVFLINFGQGLFRAASTNFFVDTLGLSGAQVLWLAGIREIPGLTLMFIAALMMVMPIPRQSALAVLLMAIGYGLYASVNTFSALVLVALVGSLGFHAWMPLVNVLTMGLATKENAGRAMGLISAVRALASIVGMGAIALATSLAESLSLRTYYVVGGVLMAVAALLILKMPRHVGAAKATQRRLLLKRRYWLYYVLTFFEGSRMQVFGSFGTLVLVQNYGMEVWQISLLLLVSSVVNFATAPLLGHLLDKRGERITLSVSYVLLALCFVGYAVLHNPWLLAGLLVMINLLVVLSMGLATYVNRIAPAEELTPTLSAGVSINHITSVTMSLLAGSLLAIVGYEALCWGAAAIIMLSVPFALALKVEGVAPAHPSLAPAE